MIQTREENKIFLTFETFANIGVIYDHSTEDRQCKEDKKSPWKPHAVHLDEKFLDNKEEI